MLLEQILAYCEMGKISLSEGEREGHDTRTDIEPSGHILPCEGAAGPEMAGGRGSAHQNEGGEPENTQDHGRDHRGCQRLEPYLSSFLCVEYCWPFGNNVNAFGNTVPLPVCINGHKLKK